MGSPRQCHVRSSGGLSVAQRVKNSRNAALQSLEFGRQRFPHDLRPSRSCGLVGMAAASVVAHVTRNRVAPLAAFARRSRSNTVGGLPTHPRARTSKVSPLSAPRSCDPMAPAARPAHVARDCVAPLAALARRNCRSCMHNGAGRGCTRMSRCRVSLPPRCSQESLPRAVTGSRCHGRPWALLPERRLQQCGAWLGSPVRGRRSCRRRLRGRLHDLLLSAAGE